MASRGGWRRMSDLGKVEEDLEEGEVIDRVSWGGWRRMSELWKVEEDEVEERVWLR